MNRILMAPAATMACMWSVRVKNWVALRTRLITSDEGWAANFINTSKVGRSWKKRATIRDCSSPIEKTKRYLLDFAPLFNWSVCNLTIL